MVDVVDANVGQLCPQKYGGVKERAMRVSWGKREKKAEAAGFLFSDWVERCAVDRLQLYLEDSVCKVNWYYRLKMPLEERSQRAPRLQAGHRNSAAAIGS